MTELAALEILLYGKTIGLITHLPGDKNLFVFRQDYVDNLNRPTLSLSFKDTMGELITNEQVARTRLPPFFSNLLPEGHMREYLALQAGVHSEREFFLLSALGKDLPGAIEVKRTAPFDWRKGTSQKTKDDSYKNTILRFSLAGVQLKFSAIWENHGGLTIPVDGIGGSWIVKLPSPIYAHVPENEFAMMGLAKKIGINVPEISLIPIDQIKGIPDTLGRLSNYAFVIKRFDRRENGQKVHIEDFAQIFGVFPEKKYNAASYRNIAQVIWAEVGEEGIIEFIRRFVFNALIGNGDMHLKNWSLIYENQQQAMLAPAYDFVSTIPYLPNDQLALTFVDSKAFSSLSYEQFKRFALKTNLLQSLVLDTVRQTVKNFAEIWPLSIDFQLNPVIAQTIDSHLQTLPIWKEQML